MLRNSFFDPRRDVAPRPRAIREGWSVTTGGAVTGRRLSP